MARKWAAVEYYSSTIGYGERHRVGEEKRPEARVEVRPPDRARVAKGVALQATPHGIKKNLMS